jgi:hypothetical protein
LNRPSDTEDKSSWYVYGEQMEREFLGATIDLGFGLMRNPAKKFDVTAPDFVELVPCDLKSCVTVFETADRYGVDPQYAVTLNVKDVENYKKHCRFGIYFYVKYPNYHALHRAEIAWVVRMVDANKWPIHTYQKRGESDHNNNAKASYVIDVRTIHRLTLMKEAA